MNLMMSFAGISLLELEGCHYLLFSADRSNGTFSLSEFRLDLKVSELAHQNVIIYQWIIADTRDDPICHQGLGNPIAVFMRGCIF